jgi:hypothetical protein
MNPLLNQPRAVLARAYRAAHKAHYETVQMYAAGSVGAAELRASADHLKAIRAAYRVVCEAEQVRAA